MYAAKKLMTNLISKRCAAYCEGAAAPDFGCPFPLCECDCHHGLAHHRHALRNREDYSLAQSVLLWVGSALLWILGSLIAIYAVDLVGCVR